MLSKSEFKHNLEEALPILQKQSAVLKTNKSLLAVGDVHGDLESVNYASKLKDELGLNKIVFIGDLVDRGSKQIETLNQLCRLLTEEKYSTYILRGNHEDLAVCKRYGFIGELEKHSFSDLEELIGLVFSSMPLILEKENYAFYMHGGIPKTDQETFNFRGIKKASAIVDPKSTEFQVLWNDPLEAIQETNKSNIEFEQSPRGKGIYCYPQSIVTKSLQKYNAKYLIRAHLKQKNGYKWYNPKVLSLFSANSGAYRNIDRCYAECVSNEEPILHFFN